MSPVPNGVECYQRMQNVNSSQSIVRFCKQFATALDTVVHGRKKLLIYRTGNKRRGLILRHLRGGLGWTCPAQILPEVVPEIGANPLTFHRGGGSVTLGAGLVSLQNTENGANFPLSFGIQTLKGF